MMGSVRGRLSFTAGMGVVLMLLLPLLPVPVSAAGRTTSIRLPSSNGSDVFRPSADHSRSTAW